MGASQTALTGSARLPILSTWALCTSRATVSVQRRRPGKHGNAAASAETGTSTSGGLAMEAQNDICPTESMLIDRTSAILIQTKHN